MQNIEIGISMIIFGIGVVIFMTKRPPSHPLTSVNFKGYAGGIAFILLGLICILKELHLL